MRRVRLSLVVLVACGSGAGVIGIDAGFDASTEDASPDSVSPRPGACVTGGFVISGLTGHQPGFTGFVGGTSNLDVDGGSATIADVYDDASVTFAFVPVADGISNITAAEGTPSVEAECVACVCLPAFYPTNMNADAGVVVYANGVALVSMTGETRASTPCGDASIQATHWAVCRNAGAAPIVQPADVPFVAIGAHTCQTELLSVSDHATGSAGGAQSSISIAQNGAQLTVQYDAGYIGSGTLAFDLVAPNVAVASANQEVTLGCNFTGGDGAPFTSGDGGAMPITAGSLVVENSTLVLSVAGTMGSGTGCESTAQTLVLACSP